MIGYPFKATDAGRSESKRPRQKNDCTVRSIALACRMSYDDAYDLLARTAGRKASKRINFRQWVREHGVPGLQFDHVTFPPVKGEPRMRLGRFCEDYPDGIWIVATAKHVFTVIDGVVHDEEPEREGRCIYCAWQVLGAPGKAG